MWKKILLVIVILVSALLVYTPHLNYQFPFHLDEWDHIGRSIRIQEQGFSYFINNTPIEVGFDLILLILSSVGINLIAFYQYLPAINIAIIALVLFFFLKKDYNYWLALAAIPFLTFLPSNVNILGIWFYVPIIGAIVFDYLYLFTLDRAVKNQQPKKLYLAALFLFIIAFIHQSSFLVLSLVTLIFLLFNYKFVKANKKAFYPFLLLAIPIIITLAFLTKGLTLLSLFYENLVWGSIVPQINYNPFLLYGILASILAGIGFYITYKQKKLLPFRIYLLIALISILQFPLTQLTFFSTYQRYIYHFMIAAVPLSAIGLYYSLLWIYNKSKLLLKKNLAKTLVILLIILILAGMSFNYYITHPKTNLYHPLEPGEKQVVESLANQTPGYVLTPIDLGITIRPVTKTHDPVLTFFDWEKSKLLKDFYESSCDIKEEFLINQYLTQDRERDILKNPNTLLLTETDYVISNSQLDCEFLEPISNTSNLYAYKVFLDKEILAKINYPINSQKDSKQINNDALATETFTAYFWISPTEFSLENSMILKSSQGDGWKTGWSLRLTNKKARAVFGNGELGVSIYSKTPLEANKPYFIALSSEDTNKKLYVNGRLENEGEIGISYYRDAKGKFKNTVIGGLWNLNHPGIIHQATIFNKTLSSKEIEEIYLETKENFS